MIITDINHTKCPPTYKQIYNITNNHSHRLAAGDTTYTSTTTTDDARILQTSESLAGRRRKLVYR